MRRYRRIRADIVFGRLRPGQKLRLEAVHDDYGVSVSTLREILNRLAAEGLVLAEGRRGFEVAPVSADNLKELAELRLLLACNAGVVRPCRLLEKAAATRRAKRLRFRPDDFRGRPDRGIRQPLHDRMTVRSKGTTV